MLNLFIGDLEDYLLSGHKWFDNQVDEDVIQEDFARRVIKGVDNSEVDGNVIVSPILGRIAPSEISGGSKTLITMMYDDRVNFDLAAIGENCFKYLKEICDVKDIYMCTDSFRRLFHHGGFAEIRVTNDNSIVKSDLELAWKVCECRD